MKFLRNFVEQIPLHKLLVILILLGVIQFVIINLKVWRPHLADQPLHEFILGKWVAINIENTEIVGLPVKVDFIDSNDVYFEREFPEMYETMERDYVVNGNRIELSPPTRLLANWYVSRADEELVIGDVNYHRAITLPWGTIAIILLACVIGGIKLSLRFQLFDNVVSHKNTEDSLPPKWANMAGFILIPTLGWIGFQIGLWGFRIITALHWHEPWISVYTLELLVLGGVLGVTLFKRNWKLRVADIVLSPLVSVGFLGIMIIGSGMFWFTFRVIAWVALGN